MKRKPIREIKEEINDLFSRLDENDIEGLMKIVEKFYEYNIPPSKFDQGFITSYALKRLSPDFKEVLREAPDKPVLDETSDIDELFENSGNAKILKKVALDIVQPIYRHGNFETDTQEVARIFKVVDADRKTCVEISADQGKLSSTIQRGIASFLVSTGREVKPSTVARLEDYWELYDEPLTGVDNRVQTCYSEIFENEYEYDQVWSLYKSPYKPDPTVEFPLLQETIDRMSEGRAFSAWIWGVYSRQYKGRQVFWIYGPDGEEGKSYLAKFLGKVLFGENQGYKVINNLKTKSRNQFTTSQYVGSKLVVYPDCNDRRILWTELFKSLAGGGRDSEVIEEKYGTANTVTLDARGLVVSNQLPELKRENWLLSRLALCSIKPLKGKKDPDIDKKYLLELPGYLNYCKEAYEELCPDNEAIKLKPETVKWIEEIIDEQEPLTKDIFLRYFVLDSTKSISFKRMKDLMELNENLKGRDYKEWNEYVNNLPGVSIVRRSEGYVFQGVGEKGLELVTGKKVDNFKQLDAKMSEPVPSFTEMEELLKRAK